VTSQLPDAALAAPALVLTAEDAARGDVPRLQASASERHGPVLRGNVPSGPDAGPCLFLVGPEVAREAMTSKMKAFSSEQGWLPVLGRGCGQAVLNTDDPLHAEQRRMLAPVLTGGMIQSHWPAIESALDDWVAGLEDGMEFDAYPSLRKLAFLAVARTIAGLPESAIDPVFRPICVVLDGQDYANESRADYVRRADAARSEIGAILREVIADRRRHRPAVARSLLDLLLDYSAFPENAEPDEAIRSFLTITLIAGHDTGATLFSRTAFVLAEQPAIADLLAKELAAAGWTAGQALPISLLDSLPYLHRFLLEVGRLYPSLLNLPRVVVEEFPIGGYRIVPGTRVALAAAATHLLARLHHDPLRFDLERYGEVENNPAARPFQMLTFGGGSRICMGMRFAQLEFKAIFARVTAQLELAPAVELPVPHTGFWAGRPAGPLRVRVRRRVSAVEPRRARSERHAATR
jgi:cytochrome P450